MGRHMDPPPYPVIDPEPSARKTFASFRNSDWRNLALATGLSFPFGYYAGRPVVMIPTMYAAASLGALAGVMLGMQASFARLTGYSENSVELAKVQSHSSQQITE